MGARRPHDVAVRTTQVTRKAELVLEMRELGANVVAGQPPPGHALRNVRVRTRKNDELEVGGCGQPGEHVAQERSEAAPLRAIGQRKPVDDDSRDAAGHTENLGRGRR